MRKDLDVILANVLPHLSEIAKAVDVLAAHQLFLYTYALSVEKLNEGLVKNVENNADFLRGLAVGLSELQKLPDALRASL